MQTDDTATDRASGNREARETAATSPVGVLFLTDLLEMGGAETQLIALAHALDSTRFRPLVGLLRGEGTLSSQLRVPIVRYRMPCAYDPRVVFGLKRTIQRERIGVLYTTHVRSALLARLARRIVRPTNAQRRLVVVTSEHSYKNPPARMVPDWLRRKTAGESDRVIAISDAQARWLRATLRCAPEQIVVIPNGIDPEQFAALPAHDSVRQEFGIGPAEPIFACIARLEPVKDHETLLAAMEGVRGHLILVGDGSCRNALEEQAAKSPLAGRVHFAGTRVDVRPILSAASAVCLASIDESLGIALLEAMAAGRPVIATNVGGIPEVVEDGETGILVPPGDPSALGKALRFAAENSSWCRQAGAAAVARISRSYSIHGRARRIEALFEALIEESRR